MVIIKCGLRLRLHPRGASAPEGEPSGSERLLDAEYGIEKIIRHWNIIKLCLFSRPYPVSLSQCSATGR